jgi:hypothetical protein
MPVKPSPTPMQAIKTLYASMGAGMPTLWLDEVPEGQGYPRAILTDEGKVPTGASYADTSPTEVFGRFSIAFKVENDSDTAEALGITLMEAFPPLALQLTFDPNAVLFRENDKTSGTGERSPDDKPIYESKIDYRVEFSPPY